MSERRTNPALDVLAGSFGFEPIESASHFVVIIPGGTTQTIVISEHLSWDPGRIEESVHYGESFDGQVRSCLDRNKWNALADGVRAEFNRRLKKEGKPSGRWKSGVNILNRILGKELTLLAWAIEDADPALTLTAIANWQGLTPEERWWLYTMTAAATGNYVTGRNRGWRKAVRYALTENPVSINYSGEPVIPEFFRFVNQAIMDSEKYSTVEDK